MTLLEDIAAAWRIPADLAESSIDKGWNGTPAHMKVDPALSQMLWGLSGAAVELLHAGAVLWTYQRLRNEPPAASLGHLAEALLVRQASPLYLRPVEEHRYFPLTDGASLAAGATALLLHLVLKKVCEEPYIRPIGSVLYPANLSLGIAKHVMPKGSRSFGTWLARSAKVLRERAALPGPVAPPAKAVSSTLQKELTNANKAAPFAPLALHTRLSIGIPYAGTTFKTPEEIEQARLAYGEPLSPWVLAEGEAHGLDEVLRRADPSSNPFLNPPDAVRALGLATPYGSPAT